MSLGDKTQQPGQGCISMFRVNIWSNTWPRTGFWRCLVGSALGDQSTLQFFIYKRRVKIQITYKKEALAEVISD